MWQRWLLRKQLFRVVFGSLYYTDSTLYPAAQRRLGERTKRETRVCEIIISSISIHGARKDYLPAPSATIPWSHDTAALPLTPFENLFSNHRRRHPVLHRRRWLCRVAAMFCGLLYGIRHHHLHHPWPDLFDQLRVGIITCENTSIPFLLVSMASADEEEGVVLEQPARVHCSSCLCGNRIEI